MDDDTMKTTDTTEARYEDVKALDWGRTALYVAIGVLVILAGAVFLLDISRVIGGVLLLVLAGVVLATLVTWHAKRLPTSARGAGKSSLYHH